jgi:hypothetical protein
MKTISFFLFLLVFATEIHAQTYVYKNERRFFNETIRSVTDGYILPERTMMWSDALLTAKNNAIFKGFSTSMFDVMYTIREGRVYAGDSHFSSDIIYTVLNGKVYRGDSNYAMDCVFTYDIATGQIFTGDSKFPLDAILYLQGDPLTNAELIAVLLATEFL